MYSMLYAPYFMHPVSNFHLLLLFIAIFQLRMTYSHSQVATLVYSLSTLVDQVAARLCSSQMILTNKRLFLAPLVDFFQLGTFSPGKS